MKKRILTIVLTLMMVFSAVPFASLSASAATTAQTSSSYYCTVKIDQSLINKSGKQYAKVKLKTYDRTGWWNTGAKVRITLRDGNGRYITSWIAKGGDTFKLGDDHSTYRIYVSYYNAPSNGGFFSDVFTSGNNFTNTGSAYRWNFSGAKNCRIY